LLQGATAFWHFSKQCNGNGTTFITTGINTEINQQITTLSRAWKSLLVTCFAYERCGHQFQVMKAIQATQTLHHITQGLKGQKLLELGL